MTPLLKASNFLLLGALANVVVACGFALWWPLQVKQEQFSLQSSSSPGCHTFEAWLQVDGDGTFRRTLSTRSGWPLDCFEGFAQIEYGRAGADWFFSGLWVPHSTQTGESIRCLPFQPTATGFAINTLFYAGILWLLFAAPFALRCRRRIKRGLCPACAYPIGASDICTECGRPLSSSR